MKILIMFAATLLVSTNSYADLQMYDKNGNRLYGHDFGNVPIYPVDDMEDPFEILDVYIRNYGDNEVTNIIDSISGNPNEIFTNDNGCPDLAPYVEPESRDNGLVYECEIKITFDPIHYGKKNKRFTVEGTENLGDMMNEIAVTIPITGTSNNANQPSN